MTSKESFIQSIIFFGKVSREDAELVTDYYINEKIAKYTHGGSSLNVTHGAFLNKEVILRAVKAARGA